MAGSELGYNVYGWTLKLVEKIPHLNVSESSEEGILGSLWYSEGLIKTEG